MSETTILTAEEILAEAQAITDCFDKYSSSDPYGWDWPTMWATFPEKCERFQALKKEYLSRFPPNN